MDENQMDFTDQELVVNYLAKSGKIIITIAGQKYNVMPLLAELFRIYRETYHKTPDQRGFVVRAAVSWLGAKFPDKDFHPIWKFVHGKFYNKVLEQFSKNRKQDKNFD